MIRFGTDGVRGVIADDFTYDLVWKIACAICRYVKTSASGEPALLVGYDTRFSSDRFAQVCAMAASAYGIPVKVSSSFVPTPSISFATVDLETDGAIMMTASHNPPRYNGIKFKGPYGGSASNDITAAIESELNAPVEDPPRPDAFF